MGFYLRKGFKLGPLRLNLSKSGFGLSAGVKGARMGVDAQGKSYVHFGRGGFYFRKRLGGAVPGKFGRAISTGGTFVWVVLILLFVMGFLFFFYR